MSNSIITEKALADAFKNLMLKESINKITINQITKECGLTRRTFYNHFKDTYELLKWIYENEVIDDIEQYYNLRGWKKAVKIVLKYTYDNKQICLNTYNSLGHEYLENFLYSIFSKALRGVIDDISKEMNVDDKIKNDIVHFFSSAIIGEFLKWLKTNRHESQEDIADRIETMLDETLYTILSKYNKET